MALFAGLANYSTVLTCRAPTGFAVYIVFPGYVCRVLNAVFSVEITGKENMEHTQLII